MVTKTKSKRIRHGLTKREAFLIAVGIVRRIPVRFDQWGFQPVREDLAGWEAYATFFSNDSYRRNCSFDSV